MENRESDQVPIEDAEQVEGGIGGPEDAGETSAAAAVEQDIAALQEELDTRDAEIERLQERLLRLQADFDNFRRREMRSRTSSASRAKGELVRKLLGVMDDMRRVAALDPSMTATPAVIDGIKLVERKLFEVVRQEGLEPVGKRGEPFDPHLHEAVGMWPAPRPEQDRTIAAVTVQGYRFGEQLLRPAQVQVYEHRPEEPGPGGTSG